MRRIVKQRHANILMSAGLGALVLLCLGGCESIAYYWQAGSGHLALLSRKQPVEAALQGPGLTQQQRARLLQAVDIRDYAERVLGLPVGDNYHHLVQLQGDYVSWNVMAAGALSLDPVQWCFPVAGCVRYRGYFKRQQAEEFAARLRRENYDVYVGPVAAYSTLGWFDDPLYSSFLDYEEVRLAGLLFHELAHQVVYVRDDTSFNESFASAVESLAVAQWLRDAGRGDELQAWTDHKRWVAVFAAWLAEQREVLQRVYLSDASDDDKLAQKQAVFDAMRWAYPELRQQHNGDNSYDGWMQQPLNNARLLSMGNYNDWLVAFKVLYARQECDWPAFYEAVRQLAMEPAELRSSSLQRLQRGDSSGFSRGGQALGCSALM